MPLLRPINATTPAQSAAIRAIVPSEDRQHGSQRILTYPCAVTLIDGTVHARAYCNLFARYSDAGDWINPETVAEIRESPHRLPVHLARLLYAAGESGQGYQICTLHFGTKPDVVYTNSACYLDFPALPQGYDMRDLVGVTPHAGRGSSGPTCGIASSETIEFTFHDDPRMAT